ncbi:MAG: type I-C CRISPR-associated protein Cas8c/Csd1 [Bacilli bacterium]|nr:type I-C CRISPR-associated protein Cas8c/Csd1 [Bacilli bacterium]
MENMYMQRLVEFANDNTDKLPATGYKQKKYQWLVTVSPQGDFDFVKASKNDQQTIPDLSRSSGVKSILLSDKAQYVFAISKDNATEKDKQRTEECHEAYKKLLDECQRETESEGIHLILEGLKNQSFVIPSDMKESDMIIFRTGTGHFSHKEPSVIKFWGNRCIPDPNGVEKKICIVCGKKEVPIERHSMEFLVGPERTKLISANGSAYLSYGLKASIVAPTCFLCEQKYGQALTYLLSKYNDPEKKGGPHTFAAGGVTYVYWTKKGGFDLGSFMTKPNVEDVKEVLQSPFTTRQSEASDFFLLVLTANKGRLVVRDYLESDISKIQARTKVFFEAQDVGRDRYYGVYTLASAMYRDASKEMQPYAVQEWVKWAVYGYPLSGRIARQTLTRIQADKNGMNSLHAAVLKSWLISNKKGEWTVLVTEENKSPAYISGRLFAVLEKIQKDAVRGNETIASKFYGTASTVPRSIFGLLIRNSQAHLSKLMKDPAKKGFAINLSKEIQNILDDLPKFPGVLKLDEQAEFGLGYYHQRQKLYTSKTKPEGANEDELKSIN